MAMIRTLAAAALLAFWPAVAAQDDPRLNDLFAALAKAKDAAIAAPIEGEIWAIWAESKSPTTALLTERGTLLFEAGDVDRALTLFRTVTALTPDFAEAWHRMAMLESERGETAAAMTALRRTLELEPRHYAALAALGGILESLGDDKAALAAFDAALAINPSLEDVRQQAKVLRRKIEGDRI